MVDTGYIAAVDKIILAGERSTIEKEIETVTSMIPGVLVKLGSTNNEMVVGTDGISAMGWLGYEDSPIPWRPANIDTIYAVDAAGDNPRAAVVSGPGMVLRAKLANGDNVVMGDKLTGTAAGALKKWVPIAEADPITTSEEFPVAVALEDGTTTDAEINLIVRSLI